MDRGANPTLQDKNGWNPLIYIILDGEGHVDLIARLLQDPHVRAGIDVQDHDNETALHWVCYHRIETLTTSVIHLLLQAGANPAVTNKRRQMPLAIIRDRNPSFHSAIALLEHAPDAEKASLVVTARLAVAATAATASNTVVPSCLQTRVAGGQPLPLVVLQPAAPLDKATGGRNTTRAWECSKSYSLMAFVLGLEGGPENTGMPQEVFRGVFMDLLMPTSDPLRRKGAGTGPPTVQG